MAEKLTFENKLRRALEQANLLRLLKCDEIQGFLFSPAVPAEQIEQFLREKKSLSG